MQELASPFSILDFFHFYHDRRPLACIDRSRIFILTLLSIPSSIRTIAVMGSDIACVGGCRHQIELVE